MVQQVSRKGAVNTLSTAFVREDNEEIQRRRLEGAQPFRWERRAQPLKARASEEGSLGLPRERAHGCRFRRCACVPGVSSLSCGGATPSRGAARARWVSSACCRT